MISQLDYVNNKRNKIGKCRPQMPPPPKQEKEAHKRRDWKRKPSEVPPTLS